MFIVSPAGAKGREIRVESSSMLNVSNHVNASLFDAEIQPCENVNGFVVKMHIFQSISDFLCLKDMWVN